MQLAQILAFRFPRNRSPKQTVKSVLANAPEPLRVSEHGPLFTWRDVDPAYCSDSELVDLVARILQECKSECLSDASVTAFWLIRAEMQRRKEALEAALGGSDEGQDIAEYAVLLAAIVVLALGAIHLIGSNVATTFSSVASSLQ